MQEQEITSDNTIVTPALPALQTLVKTAKPLPKFEGSFDTCGPIFLTGWLSDALAREKTCNFVLLADGRVVSHGVADIYRPDVEVNATGNGRCGFHIRIPESIFDGVEHQLEVREVSTGFVLLGSPKSFIGQHLTCESSKLDGAGIRGFLVLTKEMYGIDTIRLYEGDKLISEGRSWEVDGNWRRREFYTPLPADIFDGRSHGFTIRSEYGNLLLGSLALLLPHYLMPEDALLKYAREGMKASASSLAGLRYDGLIQSIKRNGLNGDLDGQQLRATLTQIYAAHQTLVRGFQENDKNFAPLSFPVHAAPKVSIVIPVHNKFHVTYHCLASLLVAANQATFEVILVDDGSSDSTLTVPKIIAGIQYVRNDESLGFIRSCNKGGGSANGEYIVMLNNDTEVTTGWLDELICAFEHFDNVGMAGAKLLYPDGTLQEAGGIVWNTGNPWNYGRQANPYDPRYCYARQADFLSGACVMLPLQLWREIGGFSETYVPAYFEDTDLAFQVRDRGYKTVYVPFSQVIHYEGISNGVSVESGIKRFQEVNRPKFKARWAAACRANGEEGKDLELNKDRNCVMRALVIDAETPRPDVDAGSYASIQGLRMLQTLGFKCTFLPQNIAWMGRYTETMQRMGIECLYSPFVGTVNEVIEKRGSEFDLIYITRYNVAKDYLEKIRQFAPKAKIVLNNSDLHFLREIRAALHNNNAEDLARSVQTRDDELSVMRQVDLVLSYTDVEKAIILSHNLSSTKVAKCPWVCETIKVVEPFEARADIAFLGGYGHAPNVEAVEWFVQKVMPLISISLPKVTFRVYGSGVPQRLMDLAKKNKNISIEGWVADVFDVYSTCRVFVAPLQSGAGIKGKVIGALAHGVPCVLSPVAAEGIPVGAGVNAAVAETPEQWAQKITEIYSNQRIWANLSKGALSFAETNYGMAQGVEAMRSALAEALLYTRAVNDTLCWH